MAIEDLKEQIARLPEQPGVYVWANAAGEALYVGTVGAGLFKSKDRGSTWRNVGLRGLVIQGLAADPTDSLVMYAATVPRGVWMSSDEGETWP